VPSLLLGCLELIITHDQKLIFTDFVAACFLVRSHGFAGNRVNKLVPKAIAGLLVHLSKRDALAGGDSRVQSDGTGYK
jgi:hypothetical protein